MSDVELRGAVEVRNVSKHFGEVVAVDDVSLQLEPGTFSALLGPSGCGKTTLLRLVAGFEEPTSGSISIGGRSVDGVPSYRRPVNTVFQNYALFPHMDVAANVGYALRQRRPRIERSAVARRVGEALDLVRLAGFERRRVWELSGGQQQRVALARALIARPEVLLLDEPLSALDAKLRGDMRGELKQLQRQLGITFLFVTHDQEEAMSMADRVAVMRSGQVLQDAPPQVIYDEPADTFVADFVGHTNLLRGVALDVVGDVATVRCERGLEVEGVASPNVVRRGDPVSLAVRPERVGIRPLGEGETGERPAVRARVLTQTFLGNHVAYRVDAEGAGELEIWRSRVAPGIAGLPVPGDEVIIEWAWHAARVIPDDRRDVPEHADRNEQEQRPEREEQTA